MEEHVRLIVFEHLRYEFHVHVLDIDLLDGICFSHHYWKVHRHILVNFCLVAQLLHLASPMNSCKRDFEVLYELVLPRW